MKLINSSVEVIEPTGYTLQDIYKQIELAGRTCYKSEDKMADTSAEDFVNRMVASKHYAMLEHGTVYLRYMTTEVNMRPELIYLNNPLTKYCVNKFSITNLDSGEVYVTTNYRVIVENDWLDDLQYLCEPTEFHRKRITARFICDRGISHELVRHRVFSFAQESTRYCNYSKDKFGNELTFIIPSQLNKEELIEEFGDIEKLEYHKDIDKFQSSEWSDAANFLQSIAWCESNYLTLLDNGWKPQQARAVLPNTLKTEVIMTGFESDWDHFFELRCAKAAHPDMQKLANELKGKFHEKEVDNKDK